MFPEPITIFVRPFRLFGIFAALSFALGYFVTYREMKRLGIPTYFLADFAFAIMIPAFLGARFLFVIERWPLYVAAPLKIFKFWEGGIVLYGGLLGGLLGGYLFCQRRKLSFALLSDPVALGLCLGLAVSRLGCFAAGCCFGKPTSLPWGISFNHPLALARPLHAPLHPTQIYSFLIGMAIFAFLLVQRRKKTFNGEILLTYLLLESGFRILLEFIRADSYVTTSLLALFILAVSSIRYLQLKQNRGDAPMIKPVPKLVVVIFAAAFFAACGIIKTQTVTRGIDIRASDVNQIQKGVTTEKQILHLFGAPTKWRETTEGKEFFYEYSKAGGPQWNLLVSIGGGTATKTLLVWFDKEGVVTEYAYKTS